MRKVERWESRRSIVIVDEKVEQYSYGRWESRKSIVIVDEKDY